MTTPEKLASLREKMIANKITVYLIGSSDPHQSEFVAECYKVRAWLSGFHGSAGTLVVTHHFAGLWVDSRYWLEAEKALVESGIQLFRIGQSDVPSIPQWIATSQNEGSVVSYDAACMSITMHQELQQVLFPRRILITPGEDLVGSLWEGRPPLPRKLVRIYQESFIGATRKEKLERIAAWMQEQGFQWYMVSALDEIAWILNLRGTDTDYSPLFHAWFLVGIHGHILFVDEEVLPEGLYSALGEDMISLSPYSTLTPYLQTLPSEDMILLPPDTTSMAVSRVLSHMNQVVISGPIPGWKAVKSNSELDALRACLHRDGVAMVQFLYWLDSQLAIGTALNEYFLAAKLSEFRALQEGYQTESFPAIVAFGANAAIVHYRPAVQDSAPIGTRGLILLDSGGQYKDGTTDITRVVSSGTPDPQEIEAYTLVLKGHIRLALARFPRGTYGVQLDILARQDLWNQGKNYGHGTGHGIGFALNVHEGPQRISPSASGVVAALEPGNVQSNEPGYYITDKFGVRIESMIAVCEDKDIPGFLGFETLTLCPYEKDLIDVTLLSTIEKEWLNAYHARVYKALNKQLSVNESKWLKQKTAPLK